MPRGVYVRTPEMLARCRQLRSQVMLRIQAEWRQTHGEDEPLQRACGIKSASILRRCGTCARVIRGPAMFSHQKSRGHEGLTVLEGDR